MSFHPYLFFTGTCREAFTRYHEIFGGELFIMRMGDAPGMQDVPPEQADMVIHAALMIDGHSLMASDDPMNNDPGPKEGIMVSFTPKTVADANRVFEALADGGQVTQPLSETFFSPGFGMCIDRFGIPWMIATEDPNAAGPATS